MSARIRVVVAKPVARSRHVPAGSAKVQKRAMPLARLTGNGMDQADAVELHALADAGVAWHTAAERLGDRKLARARAARAGGQRGAARDSFLQASAWYRFGQVPLADSDPQKRPLYRRMLEAFQDGGRLSEPRHDRIELPWRGGRLSAWLIPAAAPSPIILQLCGIAGSREEYESGSRYLTARGLGAALVDAPGQGETRLVGGLHFDEHAVDAICALVDAVAAHPACNGRVGLWGNSAGGWLAVLAAASDPRVAACCVTGGTDRPTEVLDRFPRFVAELQRMSGRDDPEEARAVFDRLAIDGDVLRNVSCPLHVVHGTPDRIFTVDGARRIFAGAGSDDKTLTEFPDGDHCVTNHSHEKHALVADWFADRLGPRRRVLGQSPSRCRGKPGARASAGLRGCAGRFMPPTHPGEDRLPWRRALCGHPSRHVDLAMARIARAHGRCSLRASKGPEAD